MNRVNQTAKSNRRKAGIPPHCTVVVTTLVILALAAGCGKAGPAATPVPPTVAGMSASFPSTTTPIPPNSVPTDESGTDGLSDEEIATLSSLEQVDDYPLYTMHYYGAYVQRASSTQGSAYPHPNPPPRRGREQAPLAWACSLFTALGDADNMLYGRNFDWEYSPAVLLFTDPPDGYASVSMVDIAYFGFEGAKARELANLPLAERRALLGAPFMPFDGMNEHGLVVGMAAVPPGEMRPDPSKETIGSLMVIREMLDHARDVGEAVAILQGYNIDMAGGPPLHYLVADSSGRSALVEFYRGEVIITPNEAPWHLATNFLRASTGELAEGECWRYDKISQRLVEAQGRLAAQDAMNLLKDVSQEGTQWSVVYGMSTGDINVTMGREYDSAHTLHLDLTSAPRPAQTPLGSVEEISLTTEDDVKLAATLFVGGRDIAVILAHQGTTGADQRTWHSFAQLITEKEFTALALDFRGWGQSEGMPLRGHQVRDVGAAIQFLREQGFDRIVCMGASMGGTTCMEVAREFELAGLVVIASPTGNMSPDDFAGLTVPKLYVCAENDTVDGIPTGLVKMVTEMHDMSPEPKKLAIIPGTAHGTELFETESGDEFREVLLDFLEGLRSPTSPTDTPTPGDLVIDAPRGEPPTLDGTLSPDEWSDAYKTELSNGGELLLMQDGDYLYLGVRAGGGPGVGSICLDRGDEIAVLHSSAALGTAVYKRAEDSWERTKSFSWRCRWTTDSAQAQEERKAFLQEDGWLANNGNMGNPGEVEFQIAMPEGSLRLAVTYLGPPTFDSVAHWPADLDDDCRSLQLVQGDTPQNLRFSPEGWVTIGGPSPASRGASSSSPETWVRTYEGGDLKSAALHALQTSDEGYLLVGATNYSHDNTAREDVYLMKTDPAGQKVWEKTYGGDKFDRGRVIIPASDGGFIILGETSSFGAGERDVYLIKIDPEGNQLWSTTLGGPAGERANAIQPTVDGGYILTGQTASFGADGNDVYLVKTDSSGKETWSQVYGGEYDEEGYAVYQTPAGGFFVLAEVLHGEGVYPEQNPDVYLIRTDGTGNETWSQVWEQDDVQGGHAMLLTPDGHYIVTGFLAPKGSLAEADFLFLEVDGDGNQVWNKPIGVEGTLEYGADIIRTPDAGYLLTGMSWRGRQGSIPLIKTSGDGEIIWRRDLASSSSPKVGLKILEALDGGYVILGNAQAGSRGFETILIKTNGEGNVTE